ncbi:peptide/nickel transport system substrate-binding protein [Klenkia soli]|uniref:Peptide/nickel transport system substrate-binding protein n=1 Tax=Klenkia soli TaxID=1052260 RepID=A0A1H0JDL7_9ACTN|nr:ABC transporter substrate-binding protein [Klenkia soli]SDO41885.1 peptide/nickel transport system substrate-binding protein [Klenkia soli]
MPRPTLRPSRRRWVAVAALALVATLTACTSQSSGGGGAGGDASTLQLQFPGAPISLNPALGGNGGSSVFTMLAYDPLIYLSGDGDLVPDLATSWDYVGEGNTVFELQLRDDVTFSDGSPMDADAVVASMEYFLQAGGSLAGQVGDVQSVEATDESTVRVTYGRPNPDAASTMTQYFGLGVVIGPAGLADPDSLLNASQGTGQYTYDAGSSVTGDRYTYQRNDGYWNPDAQQYDTVVVRVIGDPNAVLSAAQTGQLDVAEGDTSTLSLAQDAGLGVVTAPFFNWSLVLADRAGTINPALADERVRRAMGYALDRDSIAGALGPDTFAPSTQVILPDLDGYVDDDAAGYDFDLDEAKQLMAEAGYADGFSMTLLTQPVLDPNTAISQAVASALGEIGITVDLQVESTGVPAFIQAGTSDRYEALMWPSAGADMAQVTNQILAPGTVFNPFDSTDPQVQDLLGQAFAATGQQRTDLYEQANERLEQLAWVVPVISTQNIYYVAEDITGVTASVQNPNPMPVAPEADLAWRPAS